LLLAVAGQAGLLHQAVVAVVEQAVIPQAGLILQLP